MSIVINGTNLKSTTFNGQDVDSIYYNGSLVWEKPPEIQLISGIQTDGTAWIQTDFSPSDFRFSYDPMYGSDRDYGIEVEFSILKPLLSSEYQGLVGNSYETTANYTNYIRYRYNIEGNKISFHLRNGEKSLYTSSFTFNIGQKNKIKEVTQDDWSVYGYFYQEEDGIYVRKYYEYTNKRTGGYGASTKPYTILKYGNSYTPENQTGIVIHSVIFGDEKAKEYELQRILQPAIMKNKGVETVGLYDAKRDIFYGPQEGSFIPHY